MILTISTKAFNQRVNADALDYIKRNFLSETVIKHSAALEVADSEVGESSDVDTPQVTGQVTGQVRRLLAVCNGELSRAELQEKLGLRHRDNFIEAYLQPALNAGLLEMTTPDKPRSSKQKYRLTEKGRAVVVSLERREA